MTSSDDTSVLVRRHIAAVRLYALHWSDACGAAVDADDLVQDAFSAFFRRVTVDMERDGDGGMDETDDEWCRAWLCRVIRNRAISLHRSDRRRRQRERRHADDAPVWFEPDAGVGAVEIRRLRHVATMLRTLEPMAREIVVLRIWGELTFDGIAATLGISRSSVFRRYESAITALREKYEGGCDE